MGPISLSKPLPIIHSNEKIIVTDLALRHAYAYACQTKWGGGWWRLMNCVGEVTISSKNRTAAKLISEMLITQILSHTNAT